MSQLTKQQQNAFLIAKNLVFKAHFYTNYGNQFGQFTQRQRKLILTTQRDIKKTLADLAQINSDEFISLRAEGKEIDWAVSSLNKSEQIVNKLLTKIRLEERMERLS